MLLNKVLIIDDELDSCILLRAFLTHLKYDVYTALTLGEGLKLLQGVSPSIIFLDNNLPDGLGWNEVDNIRAKLPDCRIYLVSAYQFDEQKINPKGVKVFQKPFSLVNIKKHLEENF